VIPKPSRRLLLVFPVLFLLELFFGEAGSWMRVGGLSIREALFTLTVLSLYGYAALSWRSLEFSRLDAAVLIFLAVNAVWGVVVPAFHEQGPGPAFADFGGVFVLLLYFPVAALVRGGVLSWGVIRGLFAGLALLLAGTQVSLWALATWQPAMMEGTRHFLLGVYGVPDVYIGPMPDGFFRVMPAAALLLLPAFFTLARALVTGKRPLLHAVPLLVVSGGLVVAYSRTFWLAVVLGLALALAGMVLKWRLIPPVERIHTLGRELLPAVVFAAAFTLVVVAGAVQETGGGASSGETGEAPASAERAVSTLDAQDRSVRIKLAQIPPLIGEWRSAPVFGQGFGASAEGFARSQETPFSYEMLAPALLMKLGVLGLLLWLVPLIYLLADGLRSANTPGTMDRGRFAVAGLVASALAVQTNPLLFNFVGMSMLLFYLLELSDIRDSRKPREKAAASYREA